MNEFKKRKQINYYLDSIKIRRIRIMNSSNYYICKSCGHLKVLHKFISGQNSDHHCRLCTCPRFLDYSNI